MTAQAPPAPPGAQAAGDQAPHRASPRAPRRVVVVGVILLVAAALAVVLLIVRRRHVVAGERADLQARSARGVRVVVTQVAATPARRTISLPGDVHGHDQATLYAKLSGYVREVRVERGQHVSRGQILAVIESPETRDEVAAAAHDAQIAALNARRAEHLAPSGVVAEQDRDNLLAQSRIAGANLGRALALEGYTVVRAPFDGVVTARYVDPGALVPAATGGTQSAQPVVELSAVDALRVFVYVGQEVAPFVRAGDAVTLWQDELPGRRIAASVTRTAGALDPRSRTMQVEIDLDNRAWGILPGTFAHVDLVIDEPPAPLIPDEAVVIRDGRTMAARVEDEHVHYVPVELGYNDGRMVRVLSGLASGETIGTDVPVEVVEGAAVQAVPADR